MVTNFDPEILRDALNDHAIVSVTDAAGNIIHVNQKFIDISGYTQSELLGSNHRIIKSGIHPPSFYRHMWETLLSGNTWHGDVCNRGKNGELYWLRATVKPILDENGAPLQFISIRTLITEAKQRELVIKDGASSMLTVLLVEDSRTQSLLITALLGKNGHKVHVATTGEQAVEMFRDIKPDLVLMDITLPGIDGYETTRLIRAEHKEWVPIIFLSGRTETEDRVHALDVGGDDFFSKPINQVELIAKMKVMSRILAMQRKLSQYMVEHEEDDKLAVYVMDRYLNASQNDPRVEFSILSASHHFSGDAISVAHTPDGGLNVMMADAMGHGLPAAINVLPAIQAFYSMSKKGMSLDLLVSEINDKVRELSPPGRFLAATFLHIDPTSSTLTGWIGGTPKIYLYCAGKIESFSSSNLSLGIRPSSKLDLEFFSAPWSDKSMLVTCTDGVLESQGADGHELGDQWVCDIIQKYGTTLNKACFDTAWKESLAGNKPHDDASLLIINQGNVQHPKV